MTFADFKYKVLVMPPETIDSIAKEAGEKNLDPHKMLASLVTGTPYDDITLEVRGWAKRSIFEYLFGCPCSNPNG